MRSPFSPFHLILFLFVLGLLFVYLQIAVVTLTFQKLGISPNSAILLLFACLFGGLINLPLFSIKAEPPRIPIHLIFYGLLRRPLRRFSGTTVIAVNVGGCLIPVFISVYLLANNSLSLGQVVVALAVVVAICYWQSRPLPGIGMGIPMLVAPVTAALVAIIVGGESSAPLAYIAGTLGVLIGADLLHLPDIKTMGAPIASIGGAGTFDGIFLTGIIAVLLA